MAQIVSLQITVSSKKEEQKDQRQWFLFRVTHALGHALGQ